MYHSKDKSGDTNVTCVKNRADVIYNFQKWFFAMRLLPSFPWHFLEKELENGRSSEIILEILKQTCLHPLCRKYPPSVRYRRLFLSQLIKMHEASESHPLDELYDALGEVLCVEEGKGCYKTYLLPCGEAVTLSESIAVISEGTTGLVTWEAGLYLAEWAVENPHLFTARTVLELGSGVGLTGITVCRCCSPFRYVFSDCHLSVLQRLRDNLLVNGLDNQNTHRVFDSHEGEMANQNPPRVSDSHEGEMANQNPPRVSDSDDGKMAYQNPPRVSDSDEGEMASQNPPRVWVSVEDLDWELVTEEHLSVMGVNMVIAADVVYDPDLTGCLVKLLSKILRCSANGRPPDVYICSTVRNPDTYNSFKQHLANAGIRHEVMDGPVTQIFHYNRLSANIELVQLYI